MMTSDLPWKGPLFTKQFYDFCVSQGYDLSSASKFNDILSEFCKLLAKDLML
jgi:hypothetical protein